MNLLDKGRAEKINNLISLFREGDMSLVIPEAAKLANELKSAIAYNILALAHKKLGNYAAAQEMYEKLLVDNPLNTLFLCNLGNIFGDTGELDRAEECFKKCLKTDPKDYNASVNLGDIYVKKARFDEALKIFKMMLEKKNVLTADQLHDINYRVAEIYRSKGTFYYEQAIKHYGQSDNPLSSAHGLELIYRSKDKAAFLQAEKKITQAGDLNPLLAAVQTHASIRYDSANKNAFCQTPFEFIRYSKLTLKEGFNEELVENLLKIKNELDSVPQALIDKGVQSAGNFLLSSDPNVQIIKNIIINRIKEYRAYYSDSNEGFIKSWPENANLHGWIIDLKKGGSLGSHMHKLGWLSGSLYLKLEKPLGSHQGNLIFDLNGADYPAGLNSYPSKELNIEEGDIVLFPSSVFHKTVPFESEENRVTLAFDIKPIY